MEELAGTIFLTVLTIFVLGIAAFYMFTALISLELEIREGKKKNPEEGNIAFFKVSAILHFTTAILIIAHFSMSITKN